MKNLSVILLVLIAVLTGCEESVQNATDPATGSLTAKNGMQLEEDSDGIRICTDHVRLIWDKKQGGVLTRLELFDGSQWNAVLGENGNYFPIVEIKSSGTTYELNRDTAPDIEVTPDYNNGIMISVRGRLLSPSANKSPFEAIIDYEVYPEGVVFANLRLDLTQKRCELTDAEIRFAVNPSLRNAAHFRQEQLAKDWKTNHFETARFAFGVNPDRSYTNELEVLVQNKKALLGETAYIKEDGSASWKLMNENGVVETPFSYSNVIALAYGHAATGRPDTNILAHRAYHWVNFIDLDNWYPSAEVIDDMVQNGATMLVMHHEWMLKRGSNTNPHADYTVVRNHDQMTECIRYAHQKGLRVALYMRGVEMYGLDAEFFEKYLKRNWDGIYVDWHGPSGIAYHEGTFPEDDLGGRHYSPDGAYLPIKEYFAFNRRLRHIVGPKGFLIGHQGSFNTGIFANLGFDAYLPGETRSDRNMFDSVHDVMYKGMMAADMCMPWPEESPVFRSSEGAAKMAVWGLYPHILMGFKVFSLNPADPIHEPILNYWKILKKVNQEKCRVYNLPSENLPAVSSDQDNFNSIVYKESGDKYLVITANLGENIRSARLTLKPRVLGMSGVYQMYRVNIQGEEIHIGQTMDRIQTSKMGKWDYEGYILKR